MRKLRGVCIGAGYFSHFQYEAWQRIPEAEIVAFSNRDPVKAAEITKKFGLQKQNPDVLAKLQRNALDQGQSQLQRHQRSESPG